jgi:hypothetical protein
MGLCCVGLAFDRSELFAFDKPAGVPCPHLQADHTCGIHGDLEGHGFAGCARYDCLGAGQRVTELFRGDPGIFDAFRAMREVHELLSLLRASHALLAESTWRDDLERALSRTDWTLATLVAFESGKIPDEVRAFLRTLG